MNTAQFSSFSIGDARGKRKSRNAFGKALQIQMLFDGVGQPVQIAFAPLGRIEPRFRCVAGPGNQHIKRIRRIK